MLTAVQAIYTRCPIFGEIVKLCNTRSDAAKRIVLLVCMFSLFAYIKFYLNYIKMIETYGHRLRHSQLLKH